MANLGMYQGVGFVYTAYDGPDIVAMTVDGAPPGPLGRLFIVPPDEVTEMPEVAVRELTRHLSYYGVVEVKTIKQKYSIDFDIPNARIESLALIEQMDKMRFEMYVNDVITDRVSKNKIVPPPPPQIKQIMNRRGWNLEAYGIKPMGALEDKRDEALAAANMKILQLERLIKQALGRDVIELAEQELATADQPAAAEEGEEVGAGKKAKKK
jgi:hypothetical protein